MKELHADIEDGLYVASNGTLQRVIPDDEGLKKIRIDTEAFEALRSIQRGMRHLLHGRKPDIGMVAEALILRAALEPDISETVRQHVLAVYSRG